MTAVAWIALVSITVTILIVLITALINLAYRLGRMGARVEELEEWKLRMREDMHEISDKLERVAIELKAIHTLINERTEKRFTSSRTLPLDNNPMRREEDI
jgi:uncharacterized protein (UPF0335 family)